MVSFWILSIIRHLVFRGPISRHKFDNHPFTATGPKASGHRLWKSRSEMPKLQIQNPSMPRPKQKTELLREVGRTYNNQWRLHREYVLSVELTSLGAHTPYVIRHRFLQNSDLAGGGTSSGSFFGVSPQWYTSLASCECTGSRSWLHHL